MFVSEAEIERWFFSNGMLVEAVVAAELSRFAATLEANRNDIKESSGEWTRWEVRIEKKLLREEPHLATRWACEHAVSILKGYHDRRFANAGKEFADAWIAEVVLSHLRGRAPGKSSNSLNIVDCTYVGPVRTKGCDVVNEVPLLGYRPNKIESEWGDGEVRVSHWEKHMPDLEGEDGEPLSCDAVLLLLDLCDGVRLTQQYYETRHDVKVTKLEKKRKADSFGEMVTWVMTLDLTNKININQVGLSIDTSKKDLMRKAFFHDQTVYERTWSLTMKSLENRFSKLICKNICAFVGGYEVALQQYLSKKQRNC